MVKFRLALENDYKRINDFYNFMYKSNRTIEQFYWEFHHGAFGKSIYVIAEDDGKIIGTNCVIPIDLITADGKIIRSGKSEDTLVDPKYRGQKIFYKIYDYLFEKSKEQGIQVIWGFTSAKKPFKKIGFDVPFDHLQSLAVNNVWSSYKYLSSLNIKNNGFDKVKIFGLCFLSKVKTLGNFTNKVDGFKVKMNTKIIDGIDDLIESNLATLDSSFSILQNSKFQDWRIYKNPNYTKVHTFGFYNSSDKLMALLVLNSHKNNVAYIIQSTFYSDLSKKQKAEMLQYVSKQVFKSGVVLIRNWHFNTNTINKSELEIFTKSNFTVLNRGVGFVWKELDDIGYPPEKFNLSRIATQGNI